MEENNFSAPRKELILIVDDSEMNRCILSDMLEDEFDIIQAENGVEAVDILKKSGSNIALMLLDMVMPGMNGFDVLTIMNKNHWIDNIPVIMISVENSSNYIERAYALGVTDYIRRPFDALAVRHRAINTINLYANQKKLIGIVADQIYEKEKSNNLMINILSHIVEFRNGESGMHVLNIHTITEALLNRLVSKKPDLILTHEDISLISMASALHDIGKISVPDEILNKPGKLTNEEFAIMKTHSMMGAAMLIDLPFKDEPLVKVAYEICRWHHERYDGRGYPDGLVGDNIPISAQIVSIADVYDALTSERVYKKAFSHEKAMQMIINGECGTFNPILIECLQDIDEFLKEELKGSTNLQKSRRDVQRITEQMINHNELDVSEQTLGMLENERIKYQFLTSITKEIQFDYFDEPPMLTLSEWSASQLGLTKNVIDPKHNDKILKMMPANVLNDISKKLRESTPEQPVVEYECELNIDGLPKPYTMICRSMWTTGQNGENQYIGTIGKVLSVLSNRNDSLNIEYISTHDPLTGLLNVHQAKKIITETLNKNPNKKYSLVLLSIEHIKASTGEKLTQIFKDGILKFTAKRLSDALDQEDIMARLNGNTFIIFFPYQDSPNGKLSHILNETEFRYGNFNIYARMGASVTETTDRDYTALFNNASKALVILSGKDNGKYMVYNGNNSDIVYQPLKI